MQIINLPWLCSGFFNRICLHINLHEILDQTINNYHLAFQDVY